jgi:UDP-glucose 4-epimerase
MTRVVATGGAGFIGGNLCRVLGAMPEVDEVVAFDDLSTGRRENVEGTGATLVEGDLTDLSQVLAAVEGAHSVVHLGARPSVPRSLADPLASHTVNATGTMHVLEAARRTGVPHVVVASSSSVYGSNPTLPKHEDLTPAPISPYAASKLATEAYALAYTASFGLPVLAFRFFNVFGPLQPAGHAYAAVVPAFVDAALAGRPLPVHGDGTQSRDFTYVGSVARVLALAAVRHVAHPAPVNLAFGSRVTLLELIATLQDLVGTTLAVDHQPPRPGDVPHSQADRTRFESLFPGEEPVPLEQGLAETIDWFRSGCGAWSPAAGRS